MKLIFVAGPYRGKDSWEIEQNIRMAETVGFEVAAAGAVPVIPHTMYRFFDRTLTDDHWLECTAELLRRCDAIILCDGWRESSGAMAELHIAGELGMHVLFTCEDGWLERLREWVEGV